MATILPLIEDARNIFKEIQLREDDAERNRRKEFLAARNIQRVFRGWLVRKHIRKLHYAAVIFQKYWRGYKTRMNYVNVLKKHYEEMCEEHYFKMATKIQKTWRGYYVRTRIFSYYALKYWIHEVMEINKNILHRMKNYNEVIHASSMDSLEREAKQKVLFILFKLHHLLRTVEVPGIYSLMDTTQLSTLEQQLAALKYTDFMKVLHKQKLEVMKLQTSASQQELIMKKRVRQCKQHRSFEEADSSSLQAMNEIFDIKRTDINNITNNKKINSSTLLHKQKLINKEQYKEFMTKLPTYQNTWKNKSPGNSVPVQMMDKTKFCGCSK